MSQIECWTYREQTDNVIVIWFEAVNVSVKLLCYLVDISSIAIVAALVGGVILGAGVEFVVILLMRRKTKSTDESQRYTIKQSQYSKTDSCTFQCIFVLFLRDVTEKSMDNPAYTDSKTEKTPEEYYTQITNQNVMFVTHILITN